MLFNSYVFILLYLPIVLFGYYSLVRFRRVRAATAWLVLASFFFYGYWDIRYVPLLFSSICWNYWFGRQIETSTRKRLLLTAAIVGNIALLGYYKYTGFFLETVNAVFGFSYDIPHIVLPLGISFFTFTQTAYLVDVYRGETKNFKGGTFLSYLLFVTIFPHLIAGPIINYREMIPQFTRLRNFIPNYRNLSFGLVLFVIGLAKKVCVADWLATWVSSMFGCTGGLGVIEAWAAAISYTYQLYFDFSAYSEMAIGLGLMLNYKFPVNFDSPYQARSVIDFLAAMAHDTRRMGARVSVYTAGRKSIRRMSHTVQSFLMYVAHRALAWGGVDFRFLGRASWCIFGRKPRVETNGNCFATAVLLDFNVFVCCRLLGVFPGGDVCRRRAGNFIDVWTFYTVVRFEFAGFTGKIASCACNIDNCLGVGAKPTANFGKIFSSVASLGIGCGCFGAVFAYAFDAVQ